LKSNPTIAYHTLGCKLNFSETSALNRLFNEEGYEKKSFQEEADVYVINTCSVTENADKECRQLIRRVKKQNPDSNCCHYRMLCPASATADFRNRRRGFGVGSLRKIQYRKTR
jgi:tRNA A37 methylthiotransferase MiaB